MNSRALAIALGVSLVVNVFVVGAIVGAIGMNHRITEKRAQPRQFAGNPILRVSERLPKDVGERYLAAMRAQGEGSRAKMAEMRQARGDAMRALSAPDYDAKAAADALARARTAEGEMRAALETTVVEFAKDLPQDQRAVIAQSLRGGPPGGRRGRGGPGGREGRGFGPPGGGPPGEFGPQYPREGKD